MTTKTEIDKGAQKPVVKKRREISVVWLVPLVALLIAGWLGYKALAERGAVITIRFDSAAGIEAGKTKIRYRDVDIGEVEKVRLDEDLTRVLVTARIDRGATALLTETARFWVVRARVTTSEVSDLGTLFSGAYIAIAPGKEGRRRDAFIGLEQPPILTSDLPGRHYVLRAEALGSLGVGAPVYYRQIPVGRVVSYGLSEVGDCIEIRIFVEAPHHRRVFPGSRFWSAEGVSISFDAGGLKVETESLLALLSGGIAFENIDPTRTEKPAVENAVFRLYPDRRSILEGDYPVKQLMVMVFDGSVRGLAPGAPVEFRGLRIGRVISVGLELDPESMGVRVPVMVEVEPERIAITGVGPFDGGALMAELVSRGLRARLETVNLLTGQLAVVLDLREDAPPVSPVYVGDYLEVPSLPSSSGELTASVGRLVKRLEGMPLEEIAGGLEATLAEVRALAAEVRGEISPGAVSTLEELRHTLEEMRRNFGSDSPLSREGLQALEELGKAARSLRALTDTLERRPESLLHGKKESTP